MVEDQKFYATATRIVDADTIADVQYFPAMSIDDGGNGTAKQGELTQKFDAVVVEAARKVREKSYVHFAFKDPERSGIELYGDEADTAWKNFRKVSGPTLTRLVVHMEERGL